jgi:hypothetical protein
MRFSNLSPTVVEVEERTVGELPGRAPGGRTACNDVRVDGEVVEEVEEDDAGPPELQPASTSAPNARTAVLQLSEADGEPLRAAD